MSFEQIKNVTILIVDDEPVNLGALFEYFIGVGFTVFVAQEGESALRIIEENEPDIILLDIVMPGTNGFEICRRLKNQEETKDIPVIFMTALSDTVEKIKGFEAGGVDYITKPFQYEEVLARVKAQLTIRNLQLQLQEHVQLLEKEVEERKRTEEALRESKEWFLQIADNVREVFFVVASDCSEILYVNPIYEAIWGQKREELYKNPQAWMKPLHPEDRPRVVDAMKKQRRDRGEFNEEFRIARQVGSNQLTRWIWARSFPVFNESGQVYRFVGIAEDITNRKRAEAELQTAKKAAETANKAKSTFLANMSHELRTPLNGILGYTQILKRDKTLTPHQRDGIDIIHHSGEHLLTIINDVLDLSKIEARKMELTPEEFDLIRCLKSIIEIIRIKTQQKGIACSPEFMPDVPHFVYADEKRLRQILLNLLSNAVKFTEEGEIVLRVEVCEERHSASCVPDYKLVRFQVEDTGIGITPERVEEIFLPFHQVGDKRNQEKGTGLGLAISRELVSMMGGELHVTSTPGKGSAFWFALELPEVTGITETARPQRYQEVIGFYGEPRTVLIVDDEEGNRAMLRDLLLPLGFNVIEAANGLDAINKALEFHASGGRLDLVLMDLVMPLMDGFEATRQLRQTPALNDIAVIAVSASVLNQSRERSLAAGCHDYLAKPVHIDELLEKLRSHLQLEWKYVTSEALPEPSIPDGNQPIIPPSQEELTTLLHLALMGDVMGLEEQVEQLATVDVELAPFAIKIQHLIKEFLVDEIQEFLQQYMEDNT